MTEQNAGQGAHWPPPDQQGSSEPPDSDKGATPGGQDPPKAPTPPRPEEPTGDILEWGRTVMFGAPRRPATPPAPAEGEHKAETGPSTSGEQAPPPYGTPGQPGTYGQPG